MKAAKNARRVAGKVRRVVRTAQATGWLLANSGTMRNGVPTLHALMTTSAIDAITDCTKANGGGKYASRWDARRLIREIAEWYGISITFNFDKDKPL